VVRQSLASSRMQGDSSPRPPVIGTTVVEAIPFASRHLSVRLPLHAQVEAARYPGQPSVRQTLAARRCWELPLFVVRRPLGANLVAEMASNPHIFGNVSWGSGQNPIMAR
jgi:hypothetical protein